MCIPGDDNYSKLHPTIIMKEVKYTSLCIKDYFVWNIQFCLLSWTLLTRLPYCSDNLCGPSTMVPYRWYPTLQDQPIYSWKQKYSTPVKFSVNSYGKQVVQHCVLCLQYYYFKLCKIWYPLSLELEMIIYQRDQGVEYFCKFWTHM